MIVNRSPDASNVDRATSIDVDTAPLTCMYGAGAHPVSHPRTTPANGTYGAVVPISLRTCSHSVQKDNRAGFNGPHAGVRAASDRRNARPSDPLATSRSS